MAWEPLVARPARQAPAPGRRGRSRYEANGCEVSLELLLQCVGPEESIRVLPAQCEGHEDRGTRPKALGDDPARRGERLGHARRTACRQLLVHRPALWRPALRRRARCRGQPEQCRPASSTRRSASRPASFFVGASCRPTAPAYRPVGPPRPRRDRGAGAGSERAVLPSRPTTRSSMSPRPARVRATTRPGGKGQIFVFDVGRRQQALQPQAVQRLRGGRRQMRSRTASVATSRAMSGPPAMPVAPSATAA